MRRRWRAAGAALLLQAACAPNIQLPAEHPLPDARVRHVILISVDGLRPDAIEAAGAFNLRQMIDEGAYSLGAQTIFPSKTLPSHTSMLTGVDVPKHGITWNEDRAEELGRVQVPTVFDIADSLGLETAAFFGKAKFRHLVGTEALDFFATAPRGKEVLFAPQMAEDVKRYLKFRRPHLTFIHIADADIAGHGAGWMTLPYRHAVRRADAAIADIRRNAVERFGDDFVMIVTADHGGQGRSHGSDHPLDMTIPWIVWGKGVIPGEIEGLVTTYDTAATVLWLLGADRPWYWDGTPIERAFRLAPPEPAGAAADTMGARAIP